MALREQKYLVLDGADRSNFFFTPGSQGSLSRLLEEGWRVIFVREGGAHTTAVLLERSE